MINEGTDMICKFFASAMYQPEMMKQALIIPWPSEMQEHIFTTHTSFLTENMLNNELLDFIGEEEFE